MKFSFKPEKAQQAILYVAAKLPEHRNMYKVLKAIYFADKEHLHQFGRFIFGDNYVAMQHGPVPSRAYGLVKNIRFAECLGMPHHERDTTLFTVKNDDTIVPLVAPDLSVFSKSDLECLDKAIEECRPMTFGQLKRHSHDKAYDDANENDYISIESIASIAPKDAKALLDYLKDPHPG